MSENLLFLVLVVLTFVLWRHILMAILFTVSMTLTIVLSPFYWFLRRSQKGDDDE